MLLDLNEDETLLKGGLEQFANGSLRAKIKPFADRHEFPTDLVKEFLALGFMGTAYDPEYGGGGLGTRGAAIVAETLARTEPGFAAIYLCNSAPMTVIARYGSDEIKRKWLEPLCRGDFIASFGVTEPSGGSDVAGIKMRAVEDGDSFVLSGSKVFSTNAGTPLHGISTFVAVTDPELGAKGLSTFVVPVGTPGFKVGKAGRKIGWRIADSVELCARRRRRELRLTHRVDRCNVEIPLRRNRNRHSDGNDHLRRALDRRRRAIRSLLREPRAEIDVLDDDTDAGGLERCKPVLRRRRRYNGQHTETCERDRESKR